MELIDTKLGGTLSLDFVIDATEESIAKEIPQEPFCR